MPGGTLAKEAIALWRCRRFALCLLYPVVVAGGVAIGGVAAWASFLLGGSIYPLLDALPLAARESPRDSRPASPPPEHRLLIAYALIEAALLCWTLRMVAMGGYGPWELVGIGLSLGTATGGIGIPAAHELIHSRSSRSRFVGIALLAPVLYMHFRVEHVFGHHRWVATPMDPATARLGEGLWRFIVRSVPGQFVSAYRSEVQRVSRRAIGRRRNRVHIYLAIEAVLLTLVPLLFGIQALCVFLLQAATAVLFLEATNYVEHYGLERLRSADGRYEPVAATHSWNTPSLFTNSLAFNLGLHADHHAAAGTAFLQLRHRPEAPQLPAGYLAMLGLAAVPPLWRRLMDPKVEAYRSLRTAIGAATKAGDAAEQENENEHRA